MSNIVSLDAQTVLDNRPFTHPNHIHKDSNALRFMIDQVSHLLTEADNHGQMIKHFLPQPEPWTQRLILTQPAKIGRLSTISIVGFFGLARPNADWGLGDFFDNQLMSEVPNYPDLLGYATFALCNQNYGNLVLFANDAGKQHWSNSTTHRQAAHEFSPTYYRAIRIYGGILPAGITASHRLTLQQVKYFDYGDPHWRAVRTLAS